MSEDDSLQAYLNLTDDLFTGKISENNLSAFAAKLPFLDKNLLAKLASHAEVCSTTSPRHGWAIVQVTRDAAYAQNCDLFLRSLASWYLARASNHWTQPRRVSDAIHEARQGFDELNETGWLAACDWQLNALAWTKQNFSQAAQTLQNALTGLEQNDLTEFTPDCRLSLAYAQILIGEHDSALENIRLSEEDYITRKDKLNQARCWLNQASSFRRQDHFDGAFQKLEQAQLVFDEVNAFTDKAKAHYQIALGYLLKADNLPVTVDHFTRAAELFQLTELDLWHAMCINNLGSVYLFTGELVLSDRYYAEAEAVFAHHEISGLLADNLNDHGEVNILRGKPQLSVEQFKQSIKINKKLGSQLSAAVCMTNLGKAYGQSGRYQDALHYLEQAAERLKSLDSHFRLGTCEKYAALIWSQLGQPALTHEHLDRAIVNYELADQKALLSEVHNFRATAFFQQGREADAIDCLKESLAVSLAYGMRPQSALARRLLGEALAQTGQYEDALEYLQQAESDFSDMGMFMDQDATLVALGTCYASTAESERAQNSFQQALQLSDGIFPEVEWRSYIGLGNLAEARSDTNEALKAYRQAVQAFARIRQNFWQPALAGSYLQRPSRIFDGIISLASKANVAEDTLLFVEQCKASTLFGQLVNDRSFKKDSKSQELDDIESEIRFLQDQLRISLDKPLLVRAKAEYRQISIKLAEKAQQYDVLKARLERQDAREHSSVMDAINGFDLSLFRGLADRFLQKKWVALDYYLTDDLLTVLILGPDHCEVLNIPISERFRMALNACERARQSTELPTQGDLDVLGEILIPSLLNDQLTTETFLILSPHKKLHAIPWAGLLPQFSSECLVNICIPTVVPSLRSLYVLWQRNNFENSSARENGLVVGLSSFGGKYRELPSVRDEVSFLRSTLGASGSYLVEKDAAWENILKLDQLSAGKEAGLSRFSWLHIASHFFSDALVGRLGSLALSDSDIWLDKLYDLSSLPNLVTLSACNGISSFVYEGDEHVDFPSTCLAAGANSVVGSLWPVLDGVASEFTSVFYMHYLEGMSPAKAVAHTQREMMGRDGQAGQWASFMCVGLP